MLTIKQYPFTIFLIALITLILLSTLLPSGIAQANPNGGRQIMQRIMNNPCGSYVVHDGGALSFPYVYCSGRKGPGAYIHIPIRKVAMETSYPLVRNPFYLAVGLDPHSTGGKISGKVKTLQYEEKIKFNGYKLELRLLPYPATGSFNGEIRGDGSMGFNSFLVSEDQKIPSLSVPSVENIGDSRHYQASKDVDTTLLLGLMASMSSYHAEDPILFQGEPAYPLTVTSVWLLKAQASWKSYQLWEYQGTYEVCSWGRNEHGYFECDMGDDDPWWEGHYVEIDHYGWGTHLYDVRKTPWVPITVVSTDMVRWPDGTLHDSFPIHVYQVQPLLQQP